MPDGNLSDDEPHLEDALSLSNDDEPFWSIPDNEIDLVLQTGLRFGCFMVALMFFVAVVMVASLDAESSAGGLLASLDAELPLSALGLLAEGFHKQVPHVLGRPTEFTTVR